MPRSVPTPKSPPDVTFVCGGGHCDVIRHAPGEWDAAYVGYVRYAEAYRAEHGAYPDSLSEEAIDAMEAASAEHADAHHRREAMRRSVEP